MTAAKAPASHAVHMAVSVCTGLAVALGLVSVALIGPYYAGHYVCIPGPPIVTQFNWTPDMIDNSPYGGSVTVAYNTDEPGELSGRGIDYNGASAASIEPGFWNLSQVHRVHVDGTGPSPACRAYAVSFAWGWGGAPFPPGMPFGGCAGCPILGPGNETDRGEPAVMSFSSSTGGRNSTSVVLENGFSLDNQGVVSTCGGPGLNKSVLIHNLWFQVPVLTPTGLEVFNESVYSMFVPGYPPNSYSAEYWYWFPPNFGSWAVDNLSASGSPTGGWAFDYLGPCS